MRSTKWPVLLVLAAAALGLAVAFSARSTPSTAKVAEPVAAAGARAPSHHQARPGSASSATPATATAPGSAMPAAPFTGAQLLAQLAKTNQAPDAPLEPAHSAEAEAQAEAAMKQGIEAQAPSVQRIYYRAQLNAAPQVLAMHQQQLVALQQNGGSAREIAEAKAALQAATELAEKSRAELARLER